MIKELPISIIDFINKYNFFFIIGHSEPDGDCLGSQLVLASMLKRIGKQSLLCSAGPFCRPETKELEKLFVNSIKNIKINTENMAAIIVDCSTEERIGEVLSKEIKGIPTAVIDHHASGKKFGDVSFINVKSPSTTILIYQLMKKLDIRPTKQEAEHLLFGFATDTGYFRHIDSKQAIYMQLASELLTFGVSLKDMYYKMYGGRSLESKKLTGQILSRAKYIFKNKCILIFETLEEKQKFGTENRDSDTINNQLLSVKNCEVLISIREESENRCSISLRSRDKIDVGKVADSFNGGGHKNAAGFEWTGSRAEIETKLKNVFSNLL